MSRYNKNPLTAPDQNIELTQPPETSIELLTERDRKKDFYNVPTSPATDTILKVMGTGSDFTTLPARAKGVNHNQKIEVLQNGNKRQVIVSSGVSIVTLELADIDKLIGSNKPAKKMFVFSLIKMNEQAFSEGTLRRNYIQFPLHELIDIGYYSRPQSARKGFHNAIDILTSLKVKGTLQKGKKKTIEQSAIEVLFTGANIKKGTCTIFLNERINWAFVATFYTILPKYYFSLPNRASDLLYYIFYLARQRVSEIEKRGYFTIGLRAVQERLNLPSEIRNKDPQKTIKEPIEEAVTAIEEVSKDIEFTITPIYNIGDPIANYLSNGYLKINLKGKYAKDFIALSKKTTKQIQTAQKRRETITQKALAANLAKKMKSEKAIENARTKPDTE